MRSCLRSFAVSVLVGAACAWAGAAGAATPITVTSKAATDGPIRYTVRFSSKTYGDVHDTRTIRSGESDDYTWMTEPPGGQVVVAEACPDYDNLPLDASGALIRQTRIRFAPVVAHDGTATVQMSVFAVAPRGMKDIKVKGKRLHCPDMARLDQLVHFSMLTDGSTKTVTLADGTQVSVSAQR